MDCLCNKVDLRCREEKHGVHEEDHERNQSQYEVVCTFCRQRCDIIVIETIDHALQKIHRCRVSDFLFHGTLLPPSVRPL